MPSTPTPPILTLQLFLDSLFFGPYLYQRRNETKTMEILSEKISESRNSCSVRVGGVGVEDMVWASRTWCGRRGHDVVEITWNTCVIRKRKIACIALSVLPQDLKLTTPDNTHCSRNICYRALPQQEGSSYEGHRGPLCCTASANHIRPTCDALHL